MSELYPSLYQVGTRVQLTESGLRYVGRFHGNVDDLKDHSGKVKGLVVGLGAFTEVMLDRYPTDRIPFGAGELELDEVKKTETPRVSIVEIAELLTTYRTSDDDEEVAAAQELLLGLFAER